MSTGKSGLPPTVIRPSWATVLSTLTALVAVGTVALHVLGESSYRAYLQYWGIDSGVFPKSTQWVLINGYHGLVTQSAFALVAIVRNFAWWAAAAIVVALYIYVLMMPLGTDAENLWKWLTDRPLWLQRMVLYLRGAFLAMMIVPVLLLVWTAVMVTPALVGETNGRAHAEREAADFLKGCEKSKRPCVELKKDGQVLGSGFLIDGSPSYIAIFDVQLQRARVIPRKAVELIAGRAPAQPLGPAP